MSHSDPLIPAGWHITLVGAPEDLAIWRKHVACSAAISLHEGWDGRLLLSSPAILGSRDQHQTRDQAMELLADLNLRMALSHGALPLHIITVDLIRADGSRESYHSLHLQSFTAPSTAEHPRSSMKVQRALPKATRAKALLERRSSITDWRDVYDALELAEILVGDRRRLAGLLGSNAAAYDDMRRWANRFRHATPKDEGVATAMSLRDAQTLLDTIVRMALQNAKP